MSYSLPSLPANLDPALRRYLDSVKELLEVRNAQRGNPLDTSPTFRDLIDSGVIKLGDDNNLLVAGGRAFTPGEITNLMTSSIPGWLTSELDPPAPTGLTVTLNVASVELGWDESSFDNYGYTEIWRAASNNLSLAVKVGSTAGNTYVDALPTSGAYYYWVRDIARNGNEGSFNDVNGAPTSASPDAMLVTFNGFNGEYAALSWNTPTSNLAIAYYIVKLGASWDTAASVTLVNANGYSHRINLPNPTWTFWVAAVDVAGTVGVPGSVEVTVTSPAGMSVTGAIVGTKAQLTWTVPDTHSLPLVEYQITSTLAPGEIIRTLGTSLRVPITWVDTSNVIFVRAVDSAGNVGSPGFIGVHPYSPGAPVNLAASFDGPNVVLQWDAPTTGSFTVEDYEVRYGAATWDAATPYTITKSTRVDIVANWSGERQFLVKAHSILGNFGAMASTSIDIAAPSAVTSLLAQVVDNNVLLYWSGATGSLPIATYRVYRSTGTFASATLIGDKSGGFTTVFETASGVYTYWVTAVDSAGNEGAEKGVAATVAQPPDYVLDVDYDSPLDPADSGSAITLSNALYENGVILLPVNTTETYAQHFSTRSWASPQSQIDALYPIYIQPTPASGAFVEVYDYGAILDATKITVAALQEILAGAPTISCKIETGTDGTTFPNVYDGYWTVYATSFRYVRITLTVTAPTDKALLRIAGVNMRLDRKMITAAGMKSCLSTDSGGTEVVFADHGFAFVDVTAITITPAGTTAPVIAIYDFVDSGNPTGFKILLFDKAGTRVSGAASWSVRGY